ncbi:MAG: ester cyclase, partial [Vicinamibacterales bacterium]
MTLEQDQATVRRVFDEIWNKKALHLIEDTYTHDFIDHDPTLLEPVSGTDGVRELFIGNLTAFPDLKFTVEDMISE